MCTGIAIPVFSSWNQPSNFNQRNQATRFVFKILIGSHFLAEKTLTKGNPKKNQPKQAVESSSLAKNSGSRLLKTARYVPGAKIKCTNIMFQMILKFYKKANSFTSKFNNGALTAREFQQVENLYDF